LPKNSTEKKKVKTLGVRSRSTPQNRGETEDDKEKKKSTSKKRFVYAEKMLKTAKTHVRGEEVRPIGKR